MQDEGKTPISIPSIDDPSDSILEDEGAAQDDNEVSSNKDHENAMSTIGYSLLEGDCTKTVSVDKIRGCYNNHMNGYATTWAERKCDGSPVPTATVRAHISLLAQLHTRYR